MNFFHAWKQGVPPVFPVFPLFWCQNDTSFCQPSISFKLFLPSTNWIIHLQPIWRCQIHVLAVPKAGKKSTKTHQIDTVYRYTLGSPTVPHNLIPYLSAKNCRSSSYCKWYVPSSVCSLEVSLALQPWRDATQMLGAPTYQLYTPQQTEKHIGTWNWNGKETGDSYWKPSFVWGIQPPAVRTLGCVVHDLGKLDSFRPDDTRNRGTASFVGLNSWNLGTR